VLPVLLYLPVSCERDGLWACVIDTCSSFSGEAVSIGTLVDKLVPLISGRLKYIFSCATDWPGLSRAFAGTLAYFVSVFFYMVGLCLCDALCQDNITSGELLTLPRCCKTCTNFIWYQLM
jgi:hypothetical protein